MGCFLTAIQKVFLSLFCRILKYANTLVRSIKGVIVPPNSNAFSDWVRTSICSDFDLGGIKKKLITGSTENNEFCLP